MQVVMKVIRWTSHYQRLESLQVDFGAIEAHGDLVQLGDIARLSG